MHLFLYLAFVVPMIAEPIPPFFEPPRPARVEPLSNTKFEPVSKIDPRLNYVRTLNGVVKVRDYEREREKYLAHPATKTLALKQGKDQDTRLSRLRRLQRELSKYPSSPPGRKLLDEEKRLYREYEHHKDNDWKEVVLKHEQEERAAPGRERERQRKGRLQRWRETEEPLRLKQQEDNPKQATGGGTPRGMGRSKPEKAADVESKGNAGSNMRRKKSADGATEDMLGEVERAHGESKKPNAVTAASTDSDAKPGTSGY